MTGWRWVVLCLVFLTGCTPQVTVADLAATAVVRGCWPGATLPPPPVTVTPLGNPTPTPAAFTPLPDAPTLTPLPTTTPYVQCPAVPGETVKPWPTPLPPAAPFPTQVALNRPATSMLDTVMQLPDAILQLDAAAHPLTGEPVVAAIASPLLTEGTPHVYVRVRHNQSWGEVQSIDIGESSLYKHRFLSVAVTVDGNGAITVVWGATQQPTIGLWASTSRDAGISWSSPTLVLPNVYGVLDMASTLDGRISVLALVRDPLRPVLLQRDLDGQWSVPEPIPVPSVWYGSSGAIELLDSDTPDARVVVLVTAAKEVPGTVYLASRRADMASSWQVSQRSVVVESGESLLGRVRAVSASSGAVNGVGRGTVAMSFAFFDAPSLYTVASTDSGVTWGEIVQVRTEAVQSAPYGAVAYDALAQRLVVVWTCCEDAQWGGKSATHYAAWADPAEQSWRPDAPYVPVISGAVSAANTVFAQAPNTSFAWLIWKEQGGSVVARAVDLNRIIPNDQYPLPTIVPTAAEVQP